VKNVNAQELKAFFNVINSLSNKECLVYQNSTWKSMINWFKLNPNEISSQEQSYLISNFLSNYCQEFLAEATPSNRSFDQNKVSKISKLLLILIDTNQNELFSETLATITDCLLTCNKYLYMKGDKVEKCIFIFNNIIQHLTGLNLVFQVTLVKP
jgi:hypothetical protein